jgi:16S rRNA (guanine966-N2)-methyltransferase
LAGGQSNRLRIIGGRWRGRKLDFPDVEGLRPTPDRVRETLFNWLQNDIVGARCLDLFAGSGALGLEALSRGATRVVLVDSSRLVTQQLESHLRTLQCNDAVVVNLPAQGFLDRGPGGAHFDVVFLDPPFAQGLLAPCCRQLEDGGWLASHALIYTEAEKGLPLEVPANWRLHRELTAGQVCCRLFQRQPAADSAD